MGSKSVSQDTPENGDAAGVAEAYNDHRDALKRYFLSRLQCPDTAEEFTQETWVKAQHVAASGTAVANPQAYLFSLAANLVTDFFRKQARRERLLEDAQHYLWSDSNELTPERVVIARDELTAMGNSLSELRPISRKIFYLNRFEGRTNREIAGELGISIGGVAYHIKLVLDHLARARDKASSA
ncbi:MAG: RNA polymerase sigma factor [Pseudomonadota bacterium]